MATVTDKDMGYKQLMKMFKSSGKTVEIGVFGESIDEQGGSVAEYVTVNEYGTKDGRIPERSFLRSTYDEEINKILKLMSKDLYNGVLKPGYTFEQTLSIGGEYLTSKVVKKIKTAPSWAKELAESTKKAKGHDKPLVEHGIMWKAIQWKIKSK